MKPTVGRIVQYTNLGDRDGKFPPEVQAAIITKVTERKLDDNDPRTWEKTLAEEQAYEVSLHIFYPTGQFDMQDVPFTEAEPGSEEARGHWAWAPRVV